MEILGDYSKKVVREFPAPAHFFVYVRSVHREGASSDTSKPADAVSGESTKGQCNYQPVFPGKISGFMCQPFHKSWIYGLDNIFRILKYGAPVFFQRDPYLPLECLGICISTERGHCRIYDIHHLY